MGDQDVAGREREFQNLKLTRFSLFTMNSTLYWKELILSVAIRPKQVNK